MTINTGQYCAVDLSGLDTVLWGPRLLPQNYQDTNGVWHYNVNNTDLWDDPSLISIGLYPYRLIDAGPPEPEPKRYRRTLDDFVIAASEVTQQAIYTEFTQQEYDRTADTTITVSQQIAQDLARQTEEIIVTDDMRLLSSRPPLIPTEDRTDVEQYLGTCYDAVDDPNVMPQEPPGATRQLTAVPGENVDRAVVRRSLVDWAGTDYTKLTYILYPQPDTDPTGMSFKVHLENGTYLSTYNLVDQGDGSWMAETNIIGQLQGDVTLKYVLFKGVDISQMRQIDAGVPEHIFDVRWLEGNLAQRIREGTI